MKYALLIYTVLLTCLLMACAQQGQTGSTGNQGIPGAVGPTGPIGSPGQNATPVTIVQFCSNQGSTTYGHFPEQGLCIGGNLYGVYYDSFNSWLAEIVPGQYQSTSTGLTCTFVVSANCVVTEQ